MAKVENSDPLNKITSTVNDRDKKIWENEAHSLCINKETEKLKSEISRLQNATKDMVKEDKEIEKQLQDLIQAISIQQQTLETSTKSLLTLKSLKETLLEQANEMKSKYSSTLEMYHDEFQEYRSIYENACKSYKDLRSQQVELRKLEIKHMDLEVKTNILRKTQKQFENIQQKIFKTTIVKFAKFHTLYHKNQKMDSQLVELKAEEKQMLRQHLELVEAVKTKQKKKIAEKNQAKIVEKFVQNCETAKENKEMPASDKLQRFLSEEIQPCSLTSLHSFSQQPKLNKEHTKVRILDMKVMKRPVLKPSIMKKPNQQELRKKMESIIENTKRSALQSTSTQVTPTSSQKSQEAAAKPSTPTSSQKSQDATKPASQSLKNVKLEDKPPASQEKTVPSQTVKQQNDAKVFSIPEKGALVNQENISKFFNRKKSVTFQTRDEEKRKSEIGTKFSFQEPAKRFQFPGSKEENSVKLPMDIFPKPFAFTKEAPPRPEEKKNELCFGILVSSNKKATLSESEPATSTSTNASFTGPSYNTYGNESDEKKGPDEMTFDPFDASFNRSFGQAPVNTTENFTQPAESTTTFNFLGLQNKNNFFSMF